MDILIKILLSTTLVYAIHFVYKTFTSNNFDKLFMPKYQKSLHNTFIFIIILIGFIAYGVFFSVMYGMIKDIAFVVPIIKVLLVVYLLGLTTTLILSLCKRIKDRKNHNAFVLSEKKANILFFVVFFLNIFVYSIFLHDIYYEDASKVWWGNIANCIVLFFALSYSLLKSNLYLQGINKREWEYVLSPTPQDIQERHLYVLYSLNTTTLVLSDDPNNKQVPRSVYLFDLNKNTYTCFNRVVKLA